MVFAALLIVASNLSIAKADCKAVYGQGAEGITVATGSPGELGLLKALVDAFNESRQATVCWIKAGSGESLKLLKDGKADVVMVHAPAAEKAAVKEGWAAGRVLIGSNEFFIVGPVNDPAGIVSAKTAVEAYGKIAAAKACFLSRGDNSGTHKREMFVWKEAGITPSGPWYVVAKDFMRATLRRANAESCYFMTDSSTWVAEKKNLPNLKILFRGAPVLINTYHALWRPKGSSAGAVLGRSFVDFVASAKGQEIITNFGKKEFGESLYNNADYAKKFDH